MKRTVWLLIPIAAIPYVVLAALALIFMSNDIPLFGAVMDTVFRNNGLILALCVFAFSFIAFALNICCIAVCLIRNTDALSAARAAMIVKLIQIPAYVIVFFLGVMFLMTIFTFAFTVVLAVLEYFLLIMTGLLNIAAVVLAVRQRLTTYKESVWFILLQFVFCADVIASVVFYLRLRQRRADECGVIQ